VRLLDDPIRASYVGHPHPHHAPDRLRRFWMGIYLARQITDGTWPWCASRFIGLVCCDIADTTLLKSSGLNSGRQLDRRMQSLGFVEEISSFPRSERMLSASFISTGLGVSTEAATSVFGSGTAPSLAEAVQLSRVGVSVAIARRYQLKLSAHSCWESCTGSQTLPSAESAFFRSCCSEVGWSVVFTSAAPPPGFPGAVRQPEQLQFALRPSLQIRKRSPLSRRVSTQLL